MSRSDVILAVDIGTESARAALIGLDGVVRAACSRHFHLNCPRPGWVEQAPSDWWEATVMNIRSLTSADIIRPLSVACVAVCGQMHAPVPIDGRGDVLAQSVPLWCDKRAAALCDTIMSSADYEELAATAANPACPAWTGFKIAWLKDHQPDAYRSTEVFLTCKDYINYRLTGRVATDYSEASGTFLFDAEARGWSEPLCDRLGVSQSKLPQVMPADTVLGWVGDDAAEATGLPAGTPVVVGGGDMMCLLLGAGIAEFGMACDVTGSAADVSVFLAGPVADRRLMNLHHVVEGWISFGILDSGGLSLKWFKEVMCPMEAQVAVQTGMSPYDLVCRLATQAPPGSRGVYFLPYLLGERTLGTAASRGVFFGLDPSHTRADLCRAVLEGVAFDLRQSLDIIRQSGADVPVVRATGGGARSDVWCQIKADVYGTVVVALEENEGGLVGSAILGACAVGAFKSGAQAAARMVRERARFTADTAASGAYDRAYRIWRALHDGLQEEFRTAAAARLAELG